MIRSIQTIVRKPNLTQFNRGLARTVPEPLVLKETKSNISKITLNRASAYNSFDLKAITALRDAIEEAEENCSTQAIIVRGIGKAFSSGGDVKYFFSSLNSNPTKEVLLHFVRICYSQIYRNARLQKPMVSFMDGITMGLGAGLFMYGPFRIVTEKTKYAMPETNIGLFCDTSCLHYLSRLDTNLAKYITMTGNILKGEDALFAGIGTHFVPSARLDQLEDHMSNEINLNKEKINSIIQEYSVNEMHTPESHILNKENSAIIQRCFKFDNANDIMNALEKEDTEFALNAIKAITKRSPTCTVMNVENFKRSPNMTFSEVLEMEIALWGEVSVLHDFSEGIKSNIILKQKANWNPPTIKDVDLDFLYQKVYRDKEYKDPTLDLCDRTFDPESNTKYILPTQKQVLDAQRENNLSNLEDTIQWFQIKTNNKFGIRQKIESMGIH